MSIIKHSEETLNEIVHAITDADVWTEGNIVCVETSVIGTEIHAQLHELMSQYGYIHICTRIKSIVKNEYGCYMDAEHKYIHETVVWEDRYAKAGGEIWSTR